ncbi:MAG TPA: FAD-dependent oxidoreductase [Solirubrobacteraceae bacterium]|nr:FAD-dependent oxidoreductase [Solirubrobacteraceae bacterium]
MCIVGGGFTGLWTALRVKQLEPSADVIVIEADVCGGGASGRNGGFAMSFWHNFIALERACGSAEALRLARASCEAVSGIGSFCEEHSIDADYRRDGWLWTATNTAQLGAWVSTIEALKRHGVRPFEPVGAEELAARTGSGGHLAGVFEQTSATVQPAALARGLARVARERGVTVFERSPMVALERSSPPAVRTPNGSITADRVVIATGAWAARLPELRRAFVIVSSDIVITDPVPDELDRIGWRDGVSISDSRLMVHYYRTTRDGRIAFGKGGGRLAYGPRIGDSFNRESPIAPELTARLQALYRTFAGVPIAASWCGPIDRTVDGLPFFFLLGRPDVVCGAGYSGNGVGPSVLGGRVLASLALGLDDEWASCGLVRSPPRGMPGEPWRYVGGRIVRAAVARKERAEDEGRRPARADRALARLAPAGLVPLE